MKKWLSLLLPLALFVAALVFLAPNGKPTVSPYRTVEIFVDGFDHGDYRAMCGVTLLQGQTMAACAGYYSGVGAQGAYAGKWGGYYAVPGSQKVWTQAYRGKQVELAVVQFKYGYTADGQVLTAHLRKNKAGQWRIWFVQ